MFNGSMAVIAESEVERSLAAAIETAQTEAVIVERGGKGRAVVISVSEYDRLMNLAEEIDDIAAFDESMMEAGPNIQWHQVERDLDSQ